MNLTVQEYCERNDIKASIGEKVIIQAMMRREADENDVSISLRNGIIAFPERMLGFYFNLVRSDEIDG